MEASVASMCGDRRFFVLPFPITPISDQEFTVVDRFTFRRGTDRSEPSLATPVGHRSPRRGCFGGKSQDDARPISAHTQRADQRLQSKEQSRSGDESRWEDIEASIERLRPLGELALVHGRGRVAKVRHYMYDWLGVDKVELAVMAELLLRGPQTEGELRGRAARMEPIADLAALRPVLESLKSKGLIVPLTPEGRGHMITHALYPPEELARVRGRFQATASTDAGSSRSVSTPEAEADSRSSHTSRPDSFSNVRSLTAPTAALPGWETQVSELRAQFEELKATVAELTGTVEQAIAELAELKRDLGT